MYHFIHACPSAICRFSIDPDKHIAAQCSLSLIQWLGKACVSTIPMNCQIINRKGTGLAQTFGIENFSASQR